jgi:hypothetical protein
VAHGTPTMSLIPNLSSYSPRLAYNSFVIVYITFHMLHCSPFLTDFLQSFPKHGAPDALYGPSAAPPYPSAQQVQQFLTKSRITPTTLDVEHVEALLEVLVLDGEVERVSGKLLRSCYRSAMHRRTHTRLR